MFRKLAASALVAFTLGAASVAAAQPAGVAPGVREACQADFLKFCAGAGSDRASRMQCMRSHATDLSDACKAAFAARMRAHDDQAGGGQTGAQGGN